MGSVGNQNPWTSYDNYKDCSLGICSIYCPQFCYLMFPPPPQNDDSATPFSPLIIAVIGVLTTAFLLVSYYTIVTRYCKRRTVQTIAEEELNPDARDNNNQRNAPPAGLDEVSIRNITVCKYQKGDGLIEGSECAVCLSEFQENENLRLLPKCEHAFHLPCIDTWLKSHSNCPLCRTSVVSLSPHPSRSQVLATVTNVNAYRFQRPNDLILVVDDQERNCDVVLSLFDENNDERDHKDDENEARRRSVSLCTFPSRRQLLISDIVKIDEDLQMENDESWKEVGSSQVLFRG